jgi:hypothetical protein
MCGQEAPPGMGLRASMNNESNDNREEVESVTSEPTNLVRLGQEDLGRKSNPMNSPRKLGNENSPKGISYQLRSRTVYNPEQEMHQIVNEELIPESEHVANATPHSEVGEQTSNKTHSYNLRKRV